MSAQRTTVVAYDGSEPAAAALRCASRRAGPGARLVVAHVASVPAQFAGTGYHDKELERARARAAAVLGGLDSVLGEEVEVEVETAVLDGPPARELVRLAREVDASEIAVGSRGFGALRGAVLGSTSHALLHETDRPVLVIPRRAVEREARRQAAGESGGPLTVVVGYDGSENARAAVGYARDRIGAVGGGRLIAVCAYEAPADWLGDPYYQRALDEHRLRGRELLSELAQQASGASLETDLAEGPPAEALVRAAHAADAREIVVGSRGLGRFRAALGSVSHGLLHEADVPLVVVPGAAAD